MQLVDDSAARPDLELRSEVKYAVAAADLEILRQLLQSSCRSISYNRRVSVVRSVYFDSWDLSACRENLSGVGKRSKVRLRWYDRRLLTGEFFFEVKWRKNRLTGKHRLRVRADDLTAGTSYRRIVSNLSDVLPAPHREALLARPEPIVIVEYRREHFESHDRSVRFTLDYDLVFYDQTHRRMPALCLGTPMRNIVVLEGKTAPANVDALRPLLFPFAGRPTRCSKYVHGCRRVGLVGGDWGLAE